MTVPPMEVQEANNRKVLIERFLRGGFSGLEQALNILVVDDEPAVHRILSRMLAPIAWTLVSAMDGFEALQLLRGGLFDAVLTDISMPGMDGISLIGHIREGDPRIPVIVITGNSDCHTHEAAVRAGAYNVVVKPMCGDEVGDVISWIREATLGRGCMILNEFPPESRVVLWRLRDMLALQKRREPAWLDAVIDLYSEICSGPEPTGCTTILCAAAHILTLLDSPSRLVERIERTNPRLSYCALRDGPTSSALVSALLVATLESIRCWWIELRSVEGGFEVVLRTEGRSHRLAARRREKEVGFLTKATVSLGGSITAIHDGVTLSLPQAAAPAAVARAILEAKGTCMPEPLSERE